MDRETAERELGAAQLLTDAEHALIDKLGSCYGEYWALDGDPQARNVHDFAEFASHIHDLQGRVLARAAARAYPNRYRLMGGGQKRRR